MFTIGGLIGGFLAMYVLSLLWEWALFKRINDDPVTGKLSAVAAAWLSGSALAGFGMANGEPYAWFAFSIYLIPAILVGFLFYRRGMKLRDETEDGEDLTETFR